MAFIKSGNIGGSSLGGVNYEFYADYMSGSGNNRTVKLTLKLKLAGNPSYPSYYGYPARWWGKVNNTDSSWMTVKGSETWNTNQDWRTYTTTLTTNVGTTSSKSITVQFTLDSSDGMWNSTQSGSLSVGATNVPPTLGGSVSTSPSGTIPENTSSIRVTTPAAQDSNLSGYRYRVSINGAGYTEIYRGSAREFNHNVSSYGQGTTFKYAVDAYDSMDAWAPSIYSPNVTKNTFTGDNLYSNSTIDFNSTSVTFSYSGANNTNGSSTGTRAISCEGITVYNPNVGANAATITIYKTGTLPTTAYVKLDEIKNKLSTNSYRGSLNFILTTTNSYGTSRTSSKIVECDLRTSPNPVGSCSITSDSSSSAYTEVLPSKTKYFIPDSGKFIRLNWSNGSGKLGEDITYTIQAKFGNEAFVTLVSGIRELKYDFYCDKQSSSRSLVLKVITITSYGYEAARDTSSVVLHYYNPPSLSVGEVIRTEKEASIPVTVKSASSLPSIQTVGSWSGNGNGNLLPTQDAQTIKVVGLTGSGTYKISIQYNDNTGLSSNESRVVTIGQNLSVMFVNNFGLGVGGVKADINNKLNVLGNAYVNGTINATNLQVAGANVYTTNRKPSAADIGAAPSNHSHGNYMIRDSVNPGWYRSEGDTGWYSQTYGGGIFMQDSTWIRTYGGKNFYCSAEIRARGGFSLEDSNEWKAYDITRGGSRARYGIGSDSSSIAYPSIETWRPGASSYVARCDFKPEVFQFTHGGAWGKIWTNTGGHGGISIGGGDAGYLKWLRGHTDLQCRNYNDNAYSRIIASAFVTSSREKFKTNITNPNIDITSIVMSSKIQQYELVSEIEELEKIREDAFSKRIVLDEDMLTPDTKLGFVIEELSEDTREVLNPSRTEGIDLYTMISVLWKHNQEQQKQIDLLREEVELLKHSSVK